MGVDIRADPSSGPMIITPFIWYTPVVLKAHSHLLSHINNHPVINWVILDINPVEAEIIPIKQMRKTETQRRVTYLQGNGIVRDRIQTQVFRLQYSLPYSLALH